MAWYWWVLLAYLLVGAGICWWGKTRSKDVTVKPLTILFVLVGWGFVALMIVVQAIVEKVRDKK